MAKFYISSQLVFRLTFSVATLVALLMQFVRRRRTPGLLGPGVNEVSFRARPHHSVHNTLGVDTGATGPR
jgi:hypothetical protein